MDALSFYWGTNLGLVIGLVYIIANDTKWRIAYNNKLREIQTLRATK